MIVKLLIFSNVLLVYIITYVVSQDVAFPEAPVEDPAKRNSKVILIFLSWPSSEAIQSVSPVANHTKIIYILRFSIVKTCSTFALVCREMDLF
jgi:hypothetical protein